MQVGLALPGFYSSVPEERPLHWPILVAAARRAEDLGFHSIWLPDRLFFDLARYGGPPGRRRGLDPVVALAGLARVTSRVRLGTLVLSAPLRPATVLAKALATLDVLSDGRLIAGVGAGDDEGELRAAGLAPEAPGARLTRLAETVQVLHGMWQGGPFSFAGASINAVDAYCLPRPVQRPHPPVWVGGRSEGLLEVAARHADGWNTAWTQTPEEYRRRQDVLMAACDRSGRDPGSLSLSVGLHALVGEDHRDLNRRFERLQQRSSPGSFGGMTLDEWRAGRLVGTVEEVGEQLDAWRGLGVSSVIANAGPVPFAAADPDDVAMIARSAR